MDDKTMNRLRDLDACTDALAWVATQPDAQTAWDACRNPQWMIWLLSTVQADERNLRLFAADCAESVLHLVEEGHREVCAHAIATARAFANGEATQEQLDAAWAAAWGAARAAAMAAAGGAAMAAAMAAARGAARAAAMAAAMAAAWDSASADQCVNLRKYFPVQPLGGEGAK